MVGGRDEGRKACWIWVCTTVCRDVYVLRRWHVSVRHFHCWLQAGLPALTSPLDESMGEPQASSPRVSQTYLHLHLRVVSTVFKNRPGSRDEVPMEKVGKAGEVTPA